MSIINFVLNKKLVDQAYKTPTDRRNFMSSSSMGDAPKPQKTR